MKTTVFVLLSMLGVAAAARAQDPPTTPPPATQPPATQPPATQPPATPSPSTSPVSAPVTPPARVELTNDDMRRRRNAIFLMEGMLVASVKLAAMDTQSQIRMFQPGIQMFSAVPPQAHGGYLEDYGVFFMVKIPSYYPSVVKVIEDLARNPARPQIDPAQPANMERTFSRDAVMDPDAFYVKAVRDYLTNAMLDQSKSLELRGNEWLTLMARGDESGPDAPSQPATMTLRVKGSDLNDFLAGRVTRDEVLKRIEVKGTPGR